MLKRVSEPVKAITKPLFSRKYLNLQRLFDHWPLIAGAELAAICAPVDITYRETKDKKTQKKLLQATLHIAVNDAQATILHYQKDLILARIAQVFGEKLISDVRFVPPAPKPPKTRKHDFMQFPLTKAEEKVLTSVLGEVGDDDLRKALESLGQKIFQQDKRT